MKVQLNSCFCLFVGKIKTEQKVQFGNYFCPPLFSKNKKMEEGFHPRGTHAANPADIPEGHNPVYDVMLHTMHAEFPDDKPPPHIILTKDDAFDFSVDNLKASVANGFKNALHTAKAFAESPVHGASGARYLAAVEQRTNEVDMDTGSFHLDADNLLAEFAETARTFAHIGTVIFHLSSLNVFIVTEHLRVE